jgi:ketosteroid isomerase-like protein
MSVQEIQTLAQQFADAFDKKNINAVLDMLSDDLEVFDHVPYRFDNKQLFASFLNATVEGIASMNFGFASPRAVYSTSTRASSTLTTHSQASPKTARFKRSTGGLHWSSSSRVGSGRS